MTITVSFVSLPVWRTLSAGCRLSVWPTSSGEPSSRSSSFVTTTNERGVDEHTFSRVVSGASDWFFRLATGVLPVLATLLFGYTTYLSMASEDDPLVGAYSLAVYLVFLLSTASILYAHSLRNERSEVKKKRSLYIVISLFCIIGIAFFCRVSALLPQPAYCLLLAPWLLPISTALAFYFTRRSILSSSRIAGDAADQVCK